MSESQYKAAFRQSLSQCHIGSTDVPHGTYEMVSKAFKAWEIRRGFRDEEGADSPQLVKPLRGVALRAKLAAESKRRVLAGESSKNAEKQAKKTTKKIKK